MNRFWFPLFADWLERNNMDCLFRLNIKIAVWRDVRYVEQIFEIFAECSAIFQRESINFHHFGDQNILQTRKP